MTAHMTGLRNARSSRSIAWASPVISILWPSHFLSEISPEFS